MYHSGSKQEIINKLDASWPSIVHKANRMKILRDKKFQEKNERTNINKFRPRIQTASSTPKNRTLLYHVHNSDWSCEQLDHIHHIRIQQAQVRTGQFDPSCVGIGRQWLLALFAHSQLENFRC
jgi:hypothetical protein